MSYLAKIRCDMSPVAWFSKSILSPCMCNFSIASRKFLLSSRGSHSSCFNDRLRHIELWSIIQWVELVSAFPTLLITWLFSTFYPVMSWSSSSSSTSSSVLSFCSATNTSWNAVAASSALSIGQPLCQQLHRSSWEDKFSFASMWTTGSLSDASG